MHQVDYTSIVVICGLKNYVFIYAYLGNLYSFKKSFVPVNNTSTLR